METTFLGGTGVRISRLAFGTMSFGGDADEETAKKLFDRCREAGINFFDCADVYAKGDSERILGRLIQDCRNEIVLATKAYFPTGDDPNARGSSRYHLVRAVEASLTRLQTDRIDVFFLHRFDDETRLDETLRTLDDLIAQGKILYPAVSNFAAWQTVKALGLQDRYGWARMVATQPMYNLLKRQAEVEILPAALAEGMAVLPYGPLAGGLLSGKYGPDRRPEVGRIVSNKMYQTRYADPSNYAIAGKLTALAQAHGLEAPAMAIAWVASHPAVTAPLIGARNLAQLEGCLRASEVEMTDELRDGINALSATPPPATDRNEETSDHNFGTR